MKKKVNQKQIDLAWLVSDPDTEKALYHFLSPIEWAAIENKFNYFEYDMDGTILQIDSWTSLSLLNEAKRRLTIFYGIIRRERIKLAFNDPKKLLFLYSRIETHVFSKDLVKKLNSKGILKMDQLASIGRENLYSQNRIGKAGSDQIIAVFEKYDCEDLF